MAVDARWVALLAAALPLAPAGGQGEATAVAPDLPECPFDAQALRAAGGTHDCHCPEEATRGGGVWGTDVYTDDSRICRAALHAGAVSPRGGRVRLELLPGRSRYRGGERQGVVSGSYRAWPGSYRFTWTGDRQPDRVARCPDTARNLAFREDLACRCLAVDTRDGSVWGTGVYTDDSRICRAAMHAGVIGGNGGVVLVRRDRGRPAYRGSTRFGVRSFDYGPWDGSFTVLAGTGNF